MNVRICISFFLVFLMITTSLWAVPAGTLLLEKGELRLRRDLKDTFHTQRGTQLVLHNGDELQTGTDTRVNIKLDDQGDDIELFSRTFFRINDVTGEKKVVSMPIGKSRFLIRKKKSRRFQIRTANAVIGVKGTEFVVGAQDGNTSVLTLEGSVSLANREDPDVQVEIKENEASRVKQGTPPTTPVTVPPDIRKNIINADSSRGFSNITFGKVIEAPKTQKRKTKKDEKKKGELKKDKDESEGSEKEAGETSRGGDELEEIGDEINALSDDIQEIQDETEETLEAQKEIRLIISNP